MDPEGDRGILWDRFLLKAMLQGSMHNDNGEGTRMEDALHVCSTFRPNMLVETM